MKNQKFGIEIEMTGLTRRNAAKVIAEHFNTRIIEVHDNYNTKKIPDNSNRYWKIVRDSSIRTQNSRQDVGEQVELVSPICVYEDIVTLQEIVRKLRQKGAMANSSCGIHIHIDASQHNAKTLRNITNIMASKEDLIYKALQVEVARENSYCKKVDQRFLEELNKKKPKTLEQVSKIWYRGRDGRYEHYHSSRYHCLNLHSVFEKGTIEFRLFNGTLHAGKIKAYIQLCLAISHQALSQKCASRRKTVSSNEKYTFRTWLLRLGLIGDEFKTAREHLLANLEGCIAWKEPEQAIKQRERIKAQKLLEAQNAQENNNDGIRSEEDFGTDFSMRM